ncbi:MAG: cytochrome c oxidase assembly protein [Alphaproteobacteria bacterium]|nr:cytochrome c oxidase assembly protein [Alphaproteobacteria bacterium]
MNDDHQKDLRNDPKALAEKNRRLGLMVLGIVCLMVGLAYASVPLYSLFCRVTGYGGTTQVARALPDRILDRTVTVRFDSNVSDTLDWDFKPEVRTITLHLGERGFIAFHARNRSNETVTGTALYNVSPAKVGPYFNKIQCFCFGEQVLGPEQDVSMPVVFYVDPAMDDDPNLKDVTDITLSYTFFKSGSSALEDATEDFYNSDNGAISTSDF